MSNWPSVAFENEFLRDVAFELRKRVDAIRPLVSELGRERVDDLEELGGAGGGIEHQRLDLEFSLWGEPPVRVSITIYDDQTYHLRARHPYEKPTLSTFAQGRFSVSSEGLLPVTAPRDVVRIIEQTLRLSHEAMDREEAANDIRRLWETVDAP